MIYCPVKGGACHQNIVHLSARSGQCGCCGANALGDRSRSDFWPFVLFGCEVLLGARAARAPLWESILRTPGLSGPLALGKAWVTLEAKAGILFWCFLGTVKIGNKICREGQMCPRKFLVIF